MYDYYRGSSSYEDAVKNKLTVLETTGVANAHAINKMDSNLRNAFQETNNILQENNDIMKAGFGATLAMGAEIGNTMVAGFNATTNAIQDMAFGLNSAIRESTYTVVASQAMLAQTFAHGFNAVNNTLDLGFSMVNSKLDAMTDRICSKLDEIHDILNNPLLTASRELYRRALDSYNRGYYEEALEDCTKAVEKNKTDFISWYLLGHIYLFGAGKFSNVINVDKAEEAFFNAAKYIDYDLGKSDEANTLGSEIYYYLGYARLTKSNDLLVETKNTDSVKKLEEAEKASRESYRLSDKNLLALYEQAKELHFLDRDDEALQLIEKLIRADKNYALRACNDKNFESLWNRIDSLVVALRDELANKLAEEFSAIRALGRKGAELFANIKFPDEKQVSEFERFYHSELINGEILDDTLGVDLFYHPELIIHEETLLIQNICNDFDSLVQEESGFTYKSVINSDEVIKNVLSWMKKYNRMMSSIEPEIEPLEAKLKKEHDYFSVRDKYSNFCGSNDNSPDFTPQRDKLIYMINQTLEEFEELKNDIKVIQVYIDTSKIWPENKERFRKEYINELAKECAAIRDTWKKLIEERWQQIVKDFPTEEQISNFENFFNTKLKYNEKYHEHFDTELRKMFPYKFYEYRNITVFDSDYEALKSVRSGKFPHAIQYTLDYRQNEIEKTLALFEGLQDEDYFSVIKKSTAFKENCLRRLHEDIEWTVSDKKFKEMEFTIKHMKDKISECEDLQRIEKKEKRANMLKGIGLCILSIICFIIQSFISEDHPFWGGLISLASAGLAFSALFFVAGIFSIVLLIGCAVLLFIQGHPVLGVISSLAVIGTFWFCYECEYELWRAP